MAGTLINPGSSSILVGTPVRTPGTLIARLKSAPSDPDDQPETLPKTTGQLWPRGNW